MPVRTSNADWKGSLREGRGTMKFGTFEGAYSFLSRFEEGEGTNPEELIGAAHAGCFSMYLAGILAEVGYSPEDIHTTANVHIEKVDGGFGITRIDLHTQANVPGIDDATFQTFAQKAKAGCPVSKALAATPITMEAKLTEEVLVRY